MDKYIIKIPKGIMYIDKWEEFNNIFPKFPHIMDKTITGCGFTEWCITNNMDIVLCSPRNMLLDNKEAQHSGEVYRIKSDYFDKELEVDKDISKEGKVAKITLSDSVSTQEDEEKEIKNLREKIREEMDNYFISRGNLPRKILVTYDSFRVLKSVLIERGLLNKFYIIVDEWQSIFTDSRFKSDTELDFVWQLQDVKKVCYLSATPMMDEYLKDIPEFSNLPYYELDWGSLDEGRICKPNLEVHAVKSIFIPAKKIIDSIKRGDYEKIYKRDDQGYPVLVEAKEVVFYVNSVSNIVSIIKKNNLKPEECNILCARTEKNRKFIELKLGVEWTIGKVPLKDEPIKTFTFCTRTVYLGADFYSRGNLTVVLSDANVECLAVDISLDLPQILGRQRLWENPWKNSLKFFYKPLTNTTKKKIPSAAEFNKKIAEKIEETRKLLRAYSAAPEDTKSSLAKKYLRDISTNNYNDDYVGVNKRGKGKNKELFPTLNNLVLISERRAFDIQQLDYKDRFSVLSIVEQIESTRTGEEVNKFMTKYTELGNTYDKLKWLCEAELSEEARRIIEDRIEDKMKSYLSLGKDRLKALGYNSTRINKELEESVIFRNGNLDEKIYSNFKIGDKLTRNEIKEKLEQIYFELNINKTPKAQSIEEWFMVRRYQLRKNGKVKEGLELIKRKDRVISGEDV